MNSPQSGIFALGTSSHAYIEFDVLDKKNGAELVHAISSLREPRTTIGGINLVVGFRPELWSKVFPHAIARRRSRLQPGDRRHRELRHACHAA